MKLGSAKWLVIAMLGACEVVADFDRDRLDEQRTIGPTPLPMLDGATALMPDAAQPDGALIGADSELDAGLAAADAAADAAPVTTPAASLLGRRE